MSVYVGRNSFDTFVGKTLTSKKLTFQKLNNMIEPSCGLGFLLGKIYILKCLTLKSGIIAKIKFAKQRSQA